MALFQTAINIRQPGREMVEVGALRRQMQGTLMTNSGTNKPFYWLTGLVFAVVVALVILLGIFWPRFHPDSHVSIRPGMTIKQVEDLLGGPPGDYGWFWFGSSMMTEEGAMVPPGSTELVWFNDDQRIEVHFDRQNKVAAVHKRARWERRPW